MGSLTKLVKNIHYVVLLALAGFVGIGSTSFEKDKAQCADKLVALAACLNYVGGKTKSPPPDCCVGLTTVVQKSPRCLCILIKDRNEPKLGTYKVNATLALNLPSACSVPLNVTTCVDLLHLAPNSTDAKIFSDFEKNLDQKKSNITSSTTTGTEKKSNGWTVWQGIEKILVAALWAFTALWNLIGDVMSE